MKILRYTIQFHVSFATFLSKALLSKVQKVLVGNIICWIHGCKILECNLNMSVTGSSKDFTSAIYLKCGFSDGFLSFDVFLF